MYALPLWIALNGIKEGDPAVAYDRLAEAQPLAWTVSQFNEAVAALDVLWGRLTDEQKRQRPRVMQHHYEEIRR